MAALNTGNPSLLDELRRMDPNGNIAKLVEPLAWRTPFIRDMQFKEGNLPTGHQFSARTALPSIAWRRLNEGVAPSKSRSDSYTETCGILSGQNKIDRQLALINGNEAAFRASEETGYLQAYFKELENSFFYASTKATPEKIMGMAPRLDATSGNFAASQIVKATTASAGSDQTSMWLVCWGDQTVTGIYPKGSKVGLEMNDMGQQLTLDSGGVNQFVAYVTDWTWKVGLAVEDYRYLVRLCNIDNSATTFTGNALILDMIRMVNQAQDLNTGRPVIYCNRNVKTLLQTQSVDTVKNSTLTYENVGGKPVMTFMGIPIERTDAILNTEAIVV